MTEGQLFDAAAAHYRWWQKAHGGERVYGYGFYTPPCVESAGAVVFSEEGHAIDGPPAPAYPPAWASR
jgi:hypothetical protein